MTLKIDDDIVFANYDVITILQIYGQARAIQILDAWSIIFEFSLITTS